MGNILGGAYLKNAKPIRPYDVWEVWSKVAGEEQYLPHSEFKKFLKELAESQNLKYEEAAANRVLKECFCEKSGLYSYRSFTAMAFSLPRLNSSTTPKIVRSHKPRFQYRRPCFLCLFPQQNEALHFSNDEDAFLRDRVREVLCPPVQVMRHTGYAEVINGGKSAHNEDQAAMIEFRLMPMHDAFGPIPYSFYGVYDGHAGPAVALYASEYLHGLVEHKLVEMGASMLYETVLDPASVVGCLQQAFMELDEKVGHEIYKGNMDGGSTCLVVLVLRNLMFVANAGDSRAAHMHFDAGRYTLHALSEDWTPERDRQRMQRIAQLQPSVLGTRFNRRIFLGGQPSPECMGKRLPCLDYYLSHPALVTVELDDINRTPMINHARLMGKIATSRGLGDHLLKTKDDYLVKPMMTAEPEVRVFRLGKPPSRADTPQEAMAAGGPEGSADGPPGACLGTRPPVQELPSHDNDLLIIGCDGLWSSFTYDELADMVTLFVAQQPDLSPASLNSVAKSLVAATLTRNTDDVTVFIVSVGDMLKDKEPLKSLPMQVSPR